MGAFFRLGDKQASPPDMEAVYDASFPCFERPARPAQAERSAGGEQQMLAFGRALMSRPRLLALDEPSMGLAPIIVEKVFRIVKEINAPGASPFLSRRTKRAGGAVLSRSADTCSRRSSVLLHDQDRRPAGEQAA